LWAGYGTAAWSLGYGVLAVYWTIVALGLTVIIPDYRHSPFFERFNNAALLRSSPGLATGRSPNRPSAMYRYLDGNPYDGSGADIAGFPTT
jgi:hypothetical protein